MQKRKKNKKQWGAGMAHQCVLGSIPGPGIICGLSLLVLYSAPTVFSPGTPVFPSPQKPTFPNSNLILECTDISECVLVNSSLVVFRG